MRREELEAYEAAELGAMEAEVHRDPRAAAAGAFKLPGLSRLPHLQERRVWAVQDASPMPSVWSQVPFSGSLLVRLKAVPETDFEEFHGLAPRQIPDAIAMAKETGRIQFLVSSPPANFEGLDYLDPIFQELKPPLLRQVMAVEDGSDDVHVETRADRDKDYRHALIEYDTIASLRYAPYFRELHRSWRKFAKSDESTQRERGGFAGLRMAGYDEIADEILLQMSVDPPRAYHLLLYARNLLTLPGSDGVGSAIGVDVEMFNEARSLIPAIARKDDYLFPADIGALLFRQLVHGGVNPHACRTAIDLYRQSDLEQLLTRVSRAIAEVNADKILSTTSDIRVAFNNVWKSSEAIGRRADFVEGGIALGMGAIGVAVGQVPGLLFALGLAGADRLTGQLGRTAAERTVRAFSNETSVFLYDFKKRYPWTDT